MMTRALSFRRRQRRLVPSPPYVTIEAVEGGFMLRVAFPRTIGPSRVVERIIHEKDYIENFPAWGQLTMDMLISHSLMEIAVKHIDVMQRGDKEGADGRPVDAQARRNR